MLLGLPLAVADLHQLILRRRPIDQIADPGVPPGLDLAGFVLGGLVIDPAGAQGELLGLVLEEAVAVAVGADQRPRFGVAHVLHLVGGVAEADAAEVAEGAGEGGHGC